MNNYIIFGMKKTKKELYNFIKDLMTEQEFEDKIQQRFKEFNKLLDLDTIAYLIVDESGRNQEAVKKIVDLKTDSEYTIIGTVTKIYETRNFKKKNGKKGKVVNLEIKDDTSICRLVLWNKDVERIKNKKITSGSRLKIINGYTKKGYSGLEINLGRWGLLEVLSSKDIDSKNLLHANEIEGTLVKKEATRVFFKDDGEVGFVTHINIKKDSLEKKIILWDSKVKEIQKYTIGDQLLFKDVTIKQNNGDEEIHANNNTIITGI